MSDLQINDPTKSKSKLEDYGVDLKLAQITFAETAKENENKAIKTKNLFNMQNPPK